MLHVALCDDETEILDRYAGQVEELARRHGFALKTVRYPNAQAMLFAMEDLLDRLDIFYLDVQMKPVGGLEAARRLREMGSSAQIIFLTNAREYVFDSFDVSPLQYLVKGEVSPEKFEQVFLRAVQLARRREAELFICERGARQRAVPLREISYFEVVKRIVTVHWDGGTFDFYSSMDELETRLRGKGFTRAHRSFLVNLARIRRLDLDCLELSGGGTVPLGRTHARLVKEELSRFLAGALRE